MKYSEKLKDPRWQKKRLEVMQRDGFACVYCGDEKTTLNVHHTKYKGNPWDSPLKDLECVCEHCHELSHGMERAGNNINDYLIYKDTDEDNKDWFTHFLIKDGTAMMLIKLKPLILLDLKAIEDIHKLVKKSK